MSLLSRFSTYSRMPTSALNKLIIIGFRSDPFPISLIKFETKANIPSRITSWILTWCRGFKTSLFALSPTCCNLFEYKHWKLVKCPGHWNGKSFSLKIRMKVIATIQYTRNSKDEFVDHVAWSRNYRSAEDLQEQVTKMLQEHLWMGRGPRHLRRRLVFGGFDKKMPDTKIPPCKAPKSLWREHAKMDLTLLRLKG